MQGWYIADVYFHEHGYFHKYIQQHCIANVYLYPHGSFISQVNTAVKSGFHSAKQINFLQVYQAVIDQLWTVNCELRQWNCGKEKFITFLILPSKQQYFT